MRQWHSSRERIPQVKILGQAYARIALKPSEIVSEGFFLIFWGRIRFEIFKTAGANVTTSKQFSYDENSHWVSRFEKPVSAPVKNQKKAKHIFENATLGWRIARSGKFSQGRAGTVRSTLDEISERAAIQSRVAF